ncbi:hypothetical protein WBP07_10975 [Novosphingobium sp. BL-8A]|uniref:hypothetical protein n=1 Tax=Novosphingobium sp. BL-8A TaxID=3127639 RepID=UPI0037573BCD
MVTLVTVLVLLVGMPYLIAWLKGREARKRQKRPFGTGFEGAFDVFDPARARAMQTIQLQEEIGQADEGNQGELIVPARAKPVRGDDRA